MNPILFFILVSFFVGLVATCFISARLHARQYEKGHYNNNNEEGRRKVMEFSEKQKELMK